jgi:hypothetical protein
LPVIKGGEAGLTDPFLITIQESSAAAEYFQLYYDQALPPPQVPCQRQCSYFCYMSPKRGSLGRLVAAEISRYR